MTKPVLNPHTLRAYTREAFGFALYTVTIEGSQATGVHRGLVRTEADARTWIDGSDGVEVVAIVSESR